MTVAFALRPPATTVSIGSDVLRAELAPDVGGSLASLRFNARGTWVDILRPATPEALADADPRAMACFPMVPFASLIFDSTFVWDRKTYRVKPNMPDRPHALHGDAWQRRWRVTRSGAAGVGLQYAQRGEEFPFSYDARLDASVEQGELSMTLTVVNSGRDPMPAGIGFHPFFPRGHDTTLQFDAERKWKRDEHGRMLEPEPPAADDSYRVARPVSLLTCNDVYDGWSGNAVLHWRSSGVRATLSAGAAFDRLLLYSPGDRDVLCIEPISNLPDGFNLLASGSSDSGVTVLAPGESITGTMRIAASVV